jgi:hypothetical protein
MNQACRRRSGRRCRPTRWAGLAVLPHAPEGALHGSLDRPTAEALRGGRRPLVMPRLSNVDPAGNWQGSVVHDLLADPDATADLTDHLIQRLAATTPTG